MPMVTDGMFFRAYFNDVGDVKDCSQSLVIRVRKVEEQEPTPTQQTTVMHVGQSAYIHGGRREGIKVIWRKVTFRFQIP